MIRNKKKFIYFIVFIFLQNSQVIVCKQFNIKKNIIRLATLTSIAGVLFLCFKNKKNIPNPELSLGNIKVHTKLEKIEHNLPSGSNIEEDSSRTKINSIPSSEEQTEVIKNNTKIEENSTTIKQDTEKDSSIKSMTGTINISSKDDYLNYFQKHILNNEINELFFIF